MLPKISLLFFVISLLIPSKSSGFVVFYASILFSVSPLYFMTFVNINLVVLNTLMIQQRKINRLYLVFVLIHIIPSIVFGFAFYFDHRFDVKLPTIIWIFSVSIFAVALIQNIAKTLNIFQLGKCRK